MVINSHPQPTWVPLRGAARTTVPEPRGESAFGGDFDRALLTGAAGTVVGAGIGGYVGYRLGLTVSPILAGSLAVVGGIAGGAGGWFLGLELGS